MDENKGRRSEWLRRAAEGATIVVSILMALLADAAWDYRGDRAQERQLLDGLGVEFTRAATEVAGDLTARDEILARTEVLLTARQVDSPLPPPDSVPGLVRALLDWRFYTPAHAVLDDAVSSGGLELIRSEEIRGALMIYMKERDRLPVFEELERDFVALRMEPYLVEWVALDRLIARFLEPIGVARESERFLALLTNDEFGSLLQLRAARTREARIYARIIERSIAEVRAAIDAEAGG